MKKSISMRDIAAEAKVSVATVSQILGGKVTNYSSDRTKQNVMDTAARLGYRRNIGYRLMHQQSTRTIGIMIANSLMLHEEHHRKLLLGLLEEFDRRNYAVFCHIMPDDDSASVEKVREFIGRGVEHFVFVGCPRGWQELERAAARLGVNMVFTREAATRYVAPDVVNGMVKLFSYLIGRCGENFKLFCPQGWHSSLYNNRVDALQHLFPSSSRMDLIERFVVPFPDIPPNGDYAENVFRTGWQVTDDLLRQFPDLGGIAYLNDLLAWGGVSRLLEPDLKNRMLPVLGCNFERVMHHFPYPEFSTLEFDLARTIPMLAEAAVNNEECRILVPPIVHIQRN